MKRNNSVPEDIDKLPEIQARKNQQAVEELRGQKALVVKNLDDSFKKCAVQPLLDPIKEDKEDEFCKYRDDFEGGEDEVKMVGIKNHKILDIYLNPKSAEPHLHKSKAINLQPLAENIFIPNQIKTPHPDLGNIKIKDLISIPMMIPGGQRI